MQMGGWSARSQQAEPSSLCEKGYAEGTVTRKHGLSGTQSELRLDVVLRFERATYGRWRIA